MATGTVNLYKSFTYSQPEEYRFSHDSVFLARKVFEIAKEESLNVTRILDLCAGCGIVGLDFSFHAFNESPLQIERLDFLEVQEEYKTFLEKNLQTFANKAKRRPLSNIFIENYADPELNQELKSTYDLILCNPPYFRPGQGKLSPSEFKNRCRFFIDSGFSELLNSINSLLKPGGSAFILIQSLHDHKIDSSSEFLKFPELSVVDRGKIRATDLFQFIKTPIF